MDVVQIINYVADHPAVLYPLVTVAAAILPIPKTNKTLMAMRNLLDVLAANFGNAKNAGGK
ncbi:hypothetical protein [Maridesulfovibrio sp.]|uniref:hypothetical protein n=1 Tax=Maridesulfovibrio sp. TaxID=2795000 RepID=UPI002AA7D054|nr:hypothetical protein [Maridesulfovibrio sp.]